MADNFEENENNLRPHRRFNISVDESATQFADSKQRGRCC